MKTLPDTLILSPLFCFSKKKLFEEIAESASVLLDVSCESLINALNDREACGTTYFCSGAAMPHALVPGASRTLGVLAILDTPVGCNSIDADPQKIDVACTFFISDRDDCEKITKLLEQVAAAFSNQDLLNSLRIARNEEWKIRKVLEQADLLLSGQDQDTDSASHEEQGEVMP